MSKQSLLDELKQLGELLQAGIISSEEFQKEKEHILAQLRNLRTAPVAPATPPPANPHGGDYFPTALANPATQPPSSSSSQPSASPSQPSSSPRSSPIPHRGYDPASSALTLQPGMLIARRYRLKRSLGRGGMGYVFLAEDTRWGGDYALKFIAPEWANHQEIARRLQQEYQFLAKLSHPSIVRVFDIDHDDELQLLFFKMEYLEGSPLSDLIDHAKREIDRPLFAFLRIKWWLEQLASALSYAHQHGVLHRDLKPSNLMISPNDALKVMDFGIARAFTETHLSQHTSMLGTLHYSAPEILQGGVATPASDVYSFAVILYELLTGILPIGRFEFPSSLLQKQAAQLDQIIEKALHPRPTSRYPSLALCWKEIEASLSSLFEPTPDPHEESPNQDANNSPISQKSEEPHAPTHDIRDEADHPQPTTNAVVPLEESPLVSKLVHEGKEILLESASVLTHEIIQTIDLTSKQAETIETLLENSAEAIQEALTPSVYRDETKAHHAAPDPFAQIQQTEQQKSPLTEETEEEAHTTNDSQHVENSEVVEEPQNVEAPLSIESTIEQEVHTIGASENNAPEDDEPEDDEPEDSAQIRSTQTKLEALLERDRELWEKTSQEIFALLTALRGNTLKAVVASLHKSLFERSLTLSTITQPVREFFEQGKPHPILDLVPHLSFPQGSDANQKLRALIRSGYTNSLEELEINNASINDDTVALLGQGNFDRLRLLSLVNNPLTFHALPFLAPFKNLRQLRVSVDADADQITKVLCETSFLPMLESITIAEKEPTPEQIQSENAEREPLVLSVEQISAILQHRPALVSLTLPQSLLEIQDQPFPVQQLSNLLQSLPKLKSIHGLLLHNASLSDAEARIIANHPATEQLRLLSLTHNQITDQGIEALARSTSLSLRHLSLAENPITEAGIYHLIKHPSIGTHTLQSLDLRGCALSRQTVLDLRNAPRLRDIQRLRINKIHSRQRTLTLDQVIEAVDSPGFQEVEELEFNTNKLGDEGLGILTRSPILGHIRALSIVNNQITDAGIEKILQSPHLGHLQTLNLSNNQITDAGLTLLSRSERLSQITEISLGSNKITSAGVLALASSPHIHKLKKLVLWKNPIGDNGMQALAQSPNLAHLEELSVWECGITDLGIQALTESGGIAHLQKLLLANNRITAKGVEALSASPHFAQLQHLSIWKNQLGDEGVLALAKSPHLLALQELLLANNQITAKGIRGLLEATFCQHLTNLSLTDNPIGDLGAQALAESAHLSNLQALHLRNCVITPTGLLSIVQSPPLQQTQTIDVRGNTIDAETFWSLVHLPQQRSNLRIDETSLADRWISWRDVDRLIQSPLLREFKTLDLSRTNISPRKLAEILGSPYIGKLKALHLEDCEKFDFDDTDAQNLLRLPACEALLVLNLKDTTALGISGFFALAALQEQRPQLRTDYPPIIIRKEDTLDEIRRLAESPMLKGVHQIRAHGTEEGANTLLSSPHLHALHSIDTNNVSLQAISALKETHLRNLTEIFCWEATADRDQLPPTFHTLPFEKLKALGFRYATNADIKQLAASTFLKDLQSLTLYSAAFSNEGCASFVDWLRNLSVLKVFVLSIDALSAADFRSIANVLHGKTELQTLMLSGEQLDETTAKLFLFDIPSLQEVELVGTFGDAWAQSLASTTKNCGITSLTISSFETWQHTTIATLLQAPSFQSVASLIIKEETRPKPPHKIAKKEGFGAYLEHILAEKETLELSERGLTDESLRWLAEHPVVQTRDALNIHFAKNPAITDRGITWLAKSPNLLCIRSLDLSKSQITNKGLAALANSPYARNLEELNFTETKVTFRGLMQSADSPHLQRLYTLEPTFSFKERNFKPEDVIDLSRSRYLLMFKVLDFSYNPDAFSSTRTTRADEVMAALATSPYTKHIEKLSFTGNIIRNSSLSELAKAQHFDSLKTLELQWNQIGARGLQTLLSSHFLSKIELLFLDGCPIRQSGAKSLAQAKHLRHLRRINLCGMPDSDIVIPTFLENFELDHLSFLIMDNNHHFPLSNIQIIKRRAKYFKNIQTLSLKGTKIEELKPLIEEEALQGIHTFYADDKKLSRQEVATAIEKYETEPRDAPIHEAEQSDIERREAERRDAQTREAERRDTRIRDAQTRETERRDAQIRKRATVHPENRKVFKVNGVLFAMRWIPAGSFFMGSPDDDKEAQDDEKPQHKVTISQGFWMMETPVTQEQYQAIVGKNPSFCGKMGLHAPVERVDWLHAALFANRLSRSEGMQQSFVGANQALHGVGNGESDYTNNKGWRLPTEAEWEYACRAGSTDRRYGKLDDIAWHVGNSEGTTHPVGEKQPNAWGLYDMLGNVSEWCYDWYHEAGYATLVGANAVINPIFSESQRGRVNRGGCWMHPRQGARSASRDWLPPEKGKTYIGFRLVLSGVAGPEVQK